MQKYYQNEPKFNGVYSRNNLFKIKNGGGAYKIILMSMNQQELIGLLCLWMLKIFIEHKHTIK